MIRVEDYFDNSSLQFLALALCALLAVLLSLQGTIIDNSKGSIHRITGFSFPIIYRFFWTRNDFLKQNFQRSKQKLFQFRILQHRVIAVSGDEGRKVFFNEPGFTPGEAYRLLHGGVPELSNINITDEGYVDRALFSKRALHLLRKERVTNFIPILFEDLHRRMTEWGPSGTIDPFKEVQDLILQTTIRLTTCRELSENKEVIGTFAAHFWDLDKTVTPLSLLLPWFPGQAQIARQKATAALYGIISGYVKVRRNSTKPSTDTIDILISEGMSDHAIIGFVLGIIFVGVINTGVNVCWSILYMGMCPEWKAKVTAEVQSLISNHTNILSSEPLHKRLSTIPIEAWESDLPTLDAIIRETLRLSMSMTALRRNTGKDVNIAGSTVRHGDFLAYPMDDVHYDTEIYENPDKFDPGRYDIGREEDKKRNLGYLAWGAGRHPCPGMKIAKFEMKLVIALFLAGYDFELVDSFGKFPQALPVPDKNPIEQGRPSGEPCFLKYRQTAALF